MTLDGGADGTATPAATPAAPPAAPPAATGEAAYSVGDAQKDDEGVVAAAGGSPSATQPAGSTTLTEVHHGANGERRRSDPANAVSDESPAGEWRAVAAKPSLQWREVRREKPLAMGGWATGHGPRANGSRSSFPPLTRLCLATTPLHRSGRRIMLPSDMRFPWVGIRLQRPNTRMQRPAGARQRSRCLPRHPHCRLCPLPTMSRRLASAVNPHWTTLSLWRYKTCRGRNSRC